MELASVSHIAADRLRDFEPDVFITSVSHESRSLTIARTLESASARCIALSPPKPSTEHAFRKNLEYLHQQEFILSPVESDVPDMRSILRDHPQPVLKILVDGTSMSPRWYYQLLNWFAENQEPYREVTIRFAYTMAAYVEGEASFRLGKLERLSAPDPRRHKESREKALLLGLGHEARISRAIYRQAKPHLLYLYYADPPVDKRFVDKLFVNNHELIQATSIRKLIAYPIRNGQIIYQNLVDTILPIRDKYSVHLVPQGPKIFSVAAMLAQIAYPDVSLSFPVVRNPQVSDRLPAGEPVILDIVFEGDD